LNDRLKAATTETKKLEQKMAFVQDEWYFDNKKENFQNKII